MSSPDETTVAAYAALGKAVADVLTTMRGWLEISRATDGSFSAEIATNFGLQLEANEHLEALNNALSRIA